MRGEEGVLGVSFRDKLLNVRLLEDVRVSLLLAVRQRTKQHEHMPTPQCSGQVAAQAGEGSTHQKWIASSAVVKVSEVPWT